MTTRSPCVYLHMSTAIYWFWCKPVPGSRTWKIGRAKSGSFYCQTWKGVQYSDSGHIYKHGEKLVFDYEEVDTFKCVCNTEKPSAAAIMERKCNWHFSTGSYMEDDNEGYKLCTEKCEGFLKFNKSKCSKICSIWKN